MERAAEVADLLVEIAQTPDDSGQYTESLAAETEGYKPMTI